MENVETDLRKIRRNTLIKELAKLQSVCVLKPLIELNKANIEAHKEEIEYLEEVRLTLKTLENFVMTWYTTQKP